MNWRSRACALHWHVPGLGLVIAGPAAAALAGAEAAAGGVVGALVGWGISAERVRRSIPRFRVGV